MKSAEELNKIAKKANKKKREDFWKNDFPKIEAEMVEAAGEGRAHVYISNNDRGYLPKVLNAWMDDADMLLQVTIKLREQGYEIEEVPLYVGSKTLKISWDN